MIDGGILALAGAALITASPIERAIAARRLRSDADTAAGVGATLTAAYQTVDPTPLEWGGLLGRLSDPEPPAPRDIEPYDI